MTILSELPDGMGFFYGFREGDHRRIDVSTWPDKGKVYWVPFVAGQRVEGHFNTKDQAEAAALAWMDEHNGD